MQKAIPLDLPDSLRHALSSAQPWVYRTHLPAGFSAPDGSWIRARARDKVAYALYSAQGPIALRIFSTRSVPDGAFTNERVRQAFLLREPLRRRGITAYRWLNGEGDALPGIVCDLYGDYCVLSTYVNATATILPQVVDALRACRPLEGMLWRNIAEHTEAQLLWGRRPPEDLVVSEYGVKYCADLISAQKTGLYLDQRENRRYLAQYAAGKRMLNLYSYTGGFGLHAACAGATAVFSVDRTKQVLQAARRNFQLNGVQTLDEHFSCTDIMDFLHAESGHAPEFDIVVVDPPSFARNKRQLSSALKAYKRIFRLAMKRVAPLGLFAAASCTAQVTREAFMRVLGEAAEQANRRLQIIHEAGQALDHPVFAQHPEGRYLKFVVARVHLPE